MPSEPVPGRTRRRSVRRTAPLGAAAAPAWAESAGGVVWVGVPADMFVGTAEKLGLPAPAAQGSNVTAGFHCDRSGIRRGFAEPSRAQTGKTPSKFRAALYASVHHWLRAVEATNGVSDSGEAATTAVKAVPAACFGQTTTARVGVGCFTTCPFVG